MSGFYSSNRQNSYGNNRNYPVNRSDNAYSRSSGSLNSPNYSPSGSSQSNYQSRRRIDQPSQPNQADQENWGNRRIQGSQRGQRSQAGQQYRNQGYNQAATNNRQEVSKSQSVIQPKQEQQQEKSDEIVMDILDFS